MEGQKSSLGAVDNGLPDEEEAAKEASLSEGKVGSRRSRGRREVSGFSASLQSLVPCPGILGGTTTGALKQIPLSA